MRTTLDIADDVLFAAKDVARIERKPLGQVISELVRRAFAQSSVSAGALADASTTGKSALLPAAALTVSERIATYGIHPLPARGALVSNEMIDRLREADGI